MPFNGFYVSSLYFFFTFVTSFFQRDNNGNKAVQLFCAIPVAIRFLEPRELIASKNEGPYAFKHFSDGAL